MENNDIFGKQNKNENSKEYRSDDIDKLLNIMHKNKNSAESSQKNSLSDKDSEQKKTDYEQLSLKETDATKLNNVPIKPVPIHSQSVRRVEQGSNSLEKSGAGSAGSISLDDFQDNTPIKNTRKKKKQSSSVFKLGIYLVAVILASVLFSVNFIKITNDVFAFVKQDVDIEITIPEGATTKDIAKILESNGIIKYPFIYRSYTEFRISRRSYLTGKYVAGVHTVNPTMNYDQLLETLSETKSLNKVVRITIPEGYSVKDILELFEKNGMAKAEEFNEALEEYDYEFRFMDEMQNGDGLSPYRFDTNYGYRLEGYLFPDTYDFYVNENPISVINKLLINFNKKFDTSFYDRCEQLGYTVDEIITLASMIEREGNTVEDYSKISSVFHNRLNNSAAYPYLDSDATVQYALGSHKNKLEHGDTSINHPYNTYKNKGLPPGPIANPGYEAIYAALYPEQTPYYFFLTRNDGVTVYSRTLNEHNLAIAESNRIDKILASQAQN